MDVFYNPNGIGDVLIIPLNEGDIYERKIERFGDITKITNGKKGILGYNIFQASTHFELSTTGKITMTKDLLEQLKNLAAENHLQDSFDFDLSPTFVVGYVISKSPHENADKLNICQVDVGDEILQIVCGAANVDKGQLVVVAKNGATMSSGLKIKPTELRGISSNGMICSQSELGLPNTQEKKGIYVLDGSYATGDPFTF